MVHDISDVHKATLCDGLMYSTSMMIRFCVVGHHSLETDTDTLNDSQEDSAHNSGVSGSLDTTTNGQSTTSEETSNDCKVDR